MEAASGSQGTKLTFPRKDSCEHGARAHLGEEKEGSKSSGRGETWGDPDEFLSDEGCGAETIKRKEHGQQKCFGSCNEKKIVLVLCLHLDFGLKRGQELRSAGGEESCK